MNEMSEPNLYAPPKSEPVASHIIRNSIALIATGLLGVLIGTSQFAGREIERRDRVWELRGYDMEEIQHEFSLSSQISTLNLLRSGKIKEAISEQEFLLSDSIIKLGTDAKLPISRSAHAKKALQRAAQYVNITPTYSCNPWPRAKIDQALLSGGH